MTDLNRPDTAGYDAAAFSLEATHNLCVFASFAATFGPARGDLEPSYD
ncbi:hypothetical protein [Phenylobacterium sp.]|nr:hypothetical protein [Phenylobacterium sp.]MDP1875477.1 hypothetical protein [Phenylobacterium sp.]MDP3489033.1 hypothetical protein [Phenylobacterium sp.]